jgi:hypothetical protein
MFSWCLLSWAIVGGAILASGPLRDGIVADLVASPRFPIELAFGFAAGLAAIWAGLEIGVPGGPSAFRSWTPPVLLFSAWILVIGYGLIQPSGPPTMNDKRLHCFMQTLMISLPPYTAALYFLRGRIAYAQTQTGVLVGSAAATIPALWMYVACQAEPLHVLIFHLSPILIVGLLGAVVAKRTLPHI